MAITFTQLATTFTSATDQSTVYTGSAGTPVADDLLIAFVVCAGNTAAGTFSGGGFTWTLLTSAAIASAPVTHICTIWWAYAATATSTAPAYLPASAATGCAIHCVRVTGTKNQQSGATGQAVKQTATNSSTTVNPPVTFASSTIAGNGLLLFASNGTNSSTQWTAPTSFTEITEVNFNPPATSLETAALASVVTPATTYTWTMANSGNWRVFGLEFQVAGTSFDPMGMMGFFGM